MAAKAAADVSSLKRLGGGRWQTRDERFTIEPESGTWVVVDAEQTDDLGLPLVRGPFRSLGDAKDAIAAARSSPPEASPLADRIGRRQTEAAGRPANEKPTNDSKTRKEQTPSRRSPGKPEPVAAASKRKAPPAEPEEPAEPRWFAALEPDDRRRARRLVARLEDAGARDPEGMARRDIVGEVPAVAAFAIARKLDALGADADPAEVAQLLAEGRDDDLGVRWRLVDDAGRPIAIDLRSLRGGRVG
jgi:hypothetical protein